MDAWWCLHVFQGRPPLLSPDTESVFWWIDILYSLALSGQSYWNCGFTHMLSWGVATDGRFFFFCFFDTQKPRWWVSVGCLRWRCSGPHLAIGRRADANYRFRGVWSQKVRKVNFSPWTRLFRCSIHNNLTAPPFILIYLDRFLGNAIVVPLSSAAFALRGRPLSPLFFSIRWWTAVMLSPLSGVGCFGWWCRSVPGRDPIKPEKSSGLESKLSWKTNISLEK